MDGVKKRKLGVYTELGELLLNELRTEAIESKISQTNIIKGALQDYLVAQRKKRKEIELALKAYREGLE